MDDKIIFKKVTRDDCLIAGKIYYLMDNITQDFLKFTLDKIDNSFVRQAIEKGNFYKVSEEK